MSLVSSPKISVAVKSFVRTVFKSFDKSIDGTNVLAGDRVLVSDNTVIVKTGDTIKQGADKYVIIDVEVKAPASEVLAYISQVRLK